MKNPIQIEVGEWWFKGCFIQQQSHPELKPFRVFQDTEEQKTVGTCYTFQEAKRICKENEVEKYKNGYKIFISVGNNAA